MATTLIAKIAARAKQIRAKSPSMAWVTALKKAGAEYRGTTVKTTSKRSTVKAKRKTTVKRKSKVNAVKLLPQHKVFQVLTKIQAKNRKMNDNKEVYGLRRDGSEKLIIFNKDFDNPEFYAFGAEIGSVGKTKNPIKKTTTKKVGEIYYYGDGKKVGVSQLKIGRKYEWIIGAEYLEVEYIGLSKDFPTIKSGTTFGDGRHLFQFVDDGKYTKLSSRAVMENLRTIVGSMGKKVGNSTTGYKVLGKKNGQMVEVSDYPMSKPDAMKFIKQQGIENYYTNVVVVPYRGKKAIKKLGAVKKTPVSKHKDTKSHNVNIRVMSGVKKPKVQKADVDMSALNGVIKFQANKFYEVAKGANKGSVIKITSVRKPTNKNKGSALVTSYNVNFYEYRYGHLCKPFLGVITDRWLNKRSIRPRPSVKATELKKYI